MDDFLRFLFLRFKWGFRDVGTICKGCIGGTENGVVRVDEEEGVVVGDEAENQGLSRGIIYKTVLHFAIDS